MAAKSDSCLTDWVDSDVIRVTTEPVLSEGILVEPAARVLLQRNEVVRVCAERNGVFFVVPYLCDPRSKRVPQRVMWSRQLRSLNPAERAHLGLPLLGGWDAVTRYGYGCGNEYERHERHHRRHRSESGMYHGLDSGGADAESVLDPTLDPRDFEIGQLFERATGDLPACQRELHHWPVVGRLDSRPLSGGVWEPVIVGGRETLQLQPVDAAGAFQEAERHEYDQRNRATFGGGKHTAREFRLSWSVTLPHPYEARPDAPAPHQTRSGLIVPAGSRSLAFRVSRGGTPLGRVFVKVDAALPWRAAFDATRHLSDGASDFECQGPTPSESEAVGYVPAKGC